MRFSRSERFLSTRSSADFESNINPKFDLVKPNAGRSTIKIAKETQPNEKL